MLLDWLNFNILLDWVFGPEGLSELLNYCVSIELYFS